MLALRVIRMSRLFDVQRHGLVLWYPDDRPRDELDSRRLPIHDDIAEFVMRNRGAPWQVRHPIDRSLQAHEACPAATSPSDVTTGASPHSSLTLHAGSI